MLKGKRKRKHRFDASDELARRFDEVIKRAIIDINEAQKVRRAESPVKVIILGVVSSLVATFIWWVF
jgi:hypothetical protein